MSCVYNKILFFVAVFIILTGVVSAFDHTDSNRVLVVYNASFTADSDGNGTQDSLQLAQYYADFRGIPETNVLGLTLSSSSYLSVEQVKSQMAQPIMERLNQLGETNIDVVLLIQGVPYWTKGYDPHRGQVNICLDNCLITLPRVQTVSADYFSIIYYHSYFERSPTFGTDKGHFDHSLYKYGGSNMFMTCRLSAPNRPWGVMNQLEQIRYADKYISTNQYMGVSYVDSRRGWRDLAQLSNDTDVITGSYSGYEEFDKNLAYACTYVLSKNLPLGWEYSGSVIGGSGLPLATNAILYGGWYNFQSYNNYFEWMPGSVGCDLSSDSAYGHESGSSWVGGAFNQGLSCGSGVLTESYLTGHQHPNVLMYYLLQGYTFAEASTLSMQYLNWMMVNLGDPLHAPFREKTMSPDISMPVIAAGYPYISQTNLNSATVQFRINVDTSEPEVVHCGVTYGFTTNCEIGTQWRKGYWIKNALTISGLHSGSNYYYYVSHSDVAGNITNSPIQIFETLNAAPTADFTADVWTGEVPVTVTFDGSLSMDDDGVVNAWYWDFGDGTSATGVVVEHTFTNPGLPIVELNIFDDDGAGATNQHYVWVEPDEGGLVVLQNGLNGYTNTKDAYINTYSTSDQSRNYGKSTTCTIYGSASRRALLQFDLCDIPLGSIIDSAELRLVFSYLAYGDSSESCSVFRLTHDWVEGTNSSGSKEGPGATWNDYDRGNPWDTPGGDYDVTRLDSVGYSDLRRGWPASFDVKDTVEDWVSNDSDNYGFLIKPSPASFEGRFYSREWGTMNQRPLLAVVYHSPETCAIDIVPSTNGYFSPTGSLVVSYWSNLTFNIEADPHYHISDIKTYGNSIADDVFKNTFVTNYTYIWSNIYKSGEFSVLFEADGLALSVGTQSFNAVYGGANPSPQTMMLSNLCDFALNYTSSVVYSPEADGWSSMQPLEGSVDALSTLTLTNTIDIAGLDAGVYAMTCTVTSTTASIQSRELTTSLTISKGAQIISFDFLGTQFTTNQHVLSATVNSGLDVAFTLESGPATITDTTNLSFTGTGVVTLIVSQAGTTNWNAAPTLTNIFSVNKAAASITLSNLVQTYDGNACAVASQTSPTGLSLLLTYNGNAWAPTNAGTYAVTAMVNEVMYEGLITDMLVVEQRDQTILFSDIQPLKTNISWGLSASADSGFEVMFSVLSGPAIVENTTNLVFTGVGDVEVVAAQAGDGNWAPAPSITNSVKVYSLSVDAGPRMGGNELIITNGSLGNGVDITNVLVCGIAATVATQGENWVSVILSEGPKRGIAGDIVICSGSLGATTLPNAYVYYPAGEIGAWGAPYWTNLNQGMNGAVKALSSDNSGKVYAGGDFTLADGSSMPHVARWDGSSWSDMSGGVNSAAYSIDVDMSDNVFVGGSFVSAGGIGVSRIVYWADDSWESLDAGVNNTVYAVLCGNDSTVYVGGMFSTSGGGSALRIASWNTGFGLWTNLGAGISGPVMCMELDNNGTLYVGGIFTTAGEVSASRIARWDGDAWSGLGDGLDGTVRALAADCMGGVYAAGDFTMAGSESVQYVAYWNGVTWTNLGGGLNNKAYALALDDSERLYVAGFFTEAGGSSANRIARWDGEAWSSLGAGLNSTVYALESIDDQTLYVGGSFTTAGALPANYVAVWRQDPIPAVFPTSGSVTGGYEVIINGSHLGDGADITNVTLCGVAVDSINSQSATQVVVVADSAAIAGMGDIVIYSTSYGVTIASNAFAYEYESYTLVITSEYGWVFQPGLGMYTNLGGAILTNYASSSVTDGYTQYVNKGWTLQNHTPSFGTGSTAVFTLTNNTVLTWQWTTNYWLNTTSGPNGSVDIVPDWYGSGTNVTINAMAAPYYHFDNWSGDVSGAMRYANPITVTMTVPLSVMASFAENMTTNTGTPEWWLAEFGFTNDVETIATNDLDGDGIPAWQEYLADTSPVDSNSCLQMNAISFSGGRIIRWIGGTGVVQYLEWTTNTSDQGEWIIIATNHPPMAATNETLVPKTDVKGFYRIRAVR